MNAIDLDHQASRESAPRVLIVAGNWWPLSARMAIALIKHGCNVAALCPPGHPLRYVNGISHIYDYKSLSSEQALADAVGDAQPQLIVPCEDRVVLQLHELHRNRPDLRSVIERSLGDPRSFEVVAGRADLLWLARDLGIRIPDSERIESAAQAADCFVRLGPAPVMKVDGSYGGEGVRIVRSTGEAREAFKSMTTLVSLGTTVKRSIVNSDPLAVWRWRRRHQPELVMQRFVVGIPANIMVACWQGEMLGHVAVQAVSCQGITGAANVVRLNANRELVRAAELLTARLGLSGFFGLDFVLEERTGDAYLIELNPRCTQLGHLPLAQGDLAGALCARLWGRRAESSAAPVVSDLVAFFPQAIQWGVREELIKSSYHDVPWEQQSLVAQLLQVPWPERRFISRIYHAFRKPRVLEAIEFRDAIAS